MSESHVVFDPDGDFLIIARSYASPFDPGEVPCREHDESESDGTEETVVDLEPDDEAQSTSSDTTVPDSVVPDLWVPDISVPDATVPDATIPDTAVTDATVLNATVPDTAVPDNSTPEARCFKVSSAFLALYSAYFRRMMKGPYREAVEVHDDGLRHSEIEGLTWDAITIVLNIIQGNGDQVPETLELHELLEVARVVDYMKCQEAMEFYSHIWIHHLRHTIPESYNCELLLWICIAGVFWNLKIFSRCTRVAILENARGIPTLGLPVLPEIRKAADYYRMHYLGLIVKSIDRFMDNIIVGNRCSLSCESVHQGLFSKFMHFSGIYSRPRPPYTGLSVARVVEIITNLPVSSQRRKDMFSVDDEPAMLNTPWTSMVKNNRDFVFLIHIHCGFDDLIDEVLGIQLEFQGFTARDIPRPWHQG